MSNVTDAATRLCEAVRMLRHLATNLPEPIHIGLLNASDGPSVVSGAGVAAIQQTVSQAFARIGVQQLEYCRESTQQLSSFELFISRKISAALNFDYQPPASAEQQQAQQAIIEHFEFDAQIPGIARSSLITRDGVLLNTYASANRRLTPLVLVLPCGLPFELCREWFLALGERYFVMTWETRGLFGACIDFDRLVVDATAQTADLFAIMEHFGHESAHVMGICGGAAIALYAAAKHDDRVRSLSLWHGDYNLDDDSLRTAHQRNFEWLMEAAASDRSEARDLQALFVDQATLVTTPEPIAHVALFPYVNVELFYRYSRVNDALNKTNINTLLSGIDVPTLVVAGDSDQTTHIGGSRHIAQSVEGARLHIEKNGSHLAFFEHSTRSCAAAFEFMDSLLEPALT
ncbi:alpha/beta hydrolase [Pseudomonas viridiflava]|uniref:Alpha/beta hydrolase fold protein n=1 Tax=Pseudomonas viridiflava TaxID=33069 RepID=A0A3M5NXP8_PSEVI|nr:alpha/beta hydrolase [Pseudomonas viridiflava]MBA1228934.1 alpha/beta hydrolase [Pseudomonas viridiflava]RMT77228.1 Alpha/beta hydrolase fold protein [Pseudomonas viridiflava]